MIKSVIYLLLAQAALLMAQNRPVQGEQRPPELGLVDGLIIWWPFNEVSTCFQCAAGTFSVFNVMTLDAKLTNTGNAAFAVTERGLAASSEFGTTWITPAVSHDIGAGDFTWMCWAYPLSLAAYKAMISNGDFSPAFYAALAGGNFGFYSSGNLPSGTNAAIGAWQHFAAVREGTALKFYYNGEKTPTTQTLAASLANTTIRVGESGAGEPFDGYIYDVRIYNRALSADEVLRVYLGNLSSQFMFKTSLAGGRRRWIVQ